MADWHWGHGWSEAELRQQLERLAELPVNFAAKPNEMTASNGWTRDGAVSVIGCERPGLPETNGPFSRAVLGLMNYDFSDPRIVVGHFDPSTPFLGRNILLEIKGLGLRFLSGVRIAKVRHDEDSKRTIFGFRYDTLEGHIERGGEWFLLTKNHETGEIKFTIEAIWRLGDFPTWWSKLGFRAVGSAFRTLWRHRAPERLMRVIHQKHSKVLVRPGELAHRGGLSPERTSPVGDLF